MNDMDGDFFSLSKAARKPLMGSGSLISRAEVSLTPFGRPTLL